MGLINSAGGRRFLGARLPAALPAAKPVARYPAARGVAPLPRVVAPKLRQAPVQPAPRMRMRRARGV